MVMVNAEELEISVDGVVVIVSISSLKGRERQLSQLDGLLQRAIVQLPGAVR